MKACIYARTSSSDKSHNRTSLENQIVQARALAPLHNLTVEDEHVFTDINSDGTFPPTCWSGDDAEETRPALSALIEALEAREVTRVIVFRLDRLATCSEVLMALRELLDYLDARIVIAPERLEQAEDPSESFAASILRPCVVVDTEAERERKAQLRSRKREEIARLQAKVARLEDELAELG